MTDPRFVNWDFHKRKYLKFNVDNRKPTHTLLRIVQLLLALIQLHEGVKGSGGAGTGMLLPRPNLKA